MDEVSGPSYRQCEKYTLYSSATISAYPNTYCMNESLKQFMDQYGRWVGFAALAVLVLLSLFLLVKTVDAFERMGKSPYAGPNTITVTGTGRAETPPTIARVVFTVEETASTVAEAQDKATTRATAALDAIHDLDISEDDIQTTGYYTNPQYETQQPCRPGMVCAQGSPRIVGYQVSQTITVKIRNTDRAGEVLAVLGEAGVQNISGPNFEVDDDSEVMAEAREEAIKDAHKQAKMLAKQLRVRLGDVVTFYEDGGYPSPMYDGFGKGGVMEASVRSAVPLPQGQEESVVTVSVTYEIK